MVAWLDHSRSTQSRFSSVQYSATIQYSKFSSVQSSPVQYSTVQYSTVQYSTVQCGTVQCSSGQFRIRINVQFSSFSMCLCVLKCELRPLCQTWEGLQTTALSPGMTPPSTPSTHPTTQQRSRITTSLQLTTQGHQGRHPPRLGTICHLCKWQRRLDISAACATT